MDWEEFSCGGKTCKRKNDLRRHFTLKHLGDQRPEDRCKPDTKRKFDDDEDEHPDPEAGLRSRKRARLQ
jgi:hypothetical protein